MFVFPFLSFFTVHCKRWRSLLGLFSNLSQYFYIYLKAFVTSGHVCALGLGQFFFKVNVNLTVRCQWPLHWLMLIKKWLTQFGAEQPDCPAQSPDLIQRWDKVEHQLGSDLNIQHQCWTLLKHLWLNEQITSARL